MNYRHAYHAGNFADVLKHAVFALCIEHLKLKPAPFRVIDLHAGAGRYDLAGREAGKTLESLDGIGRLLGTDAAPIPDAAASVLEPLLGVVRVLNPEGTLSVYPGSPLIAQALMRRIDCLVVNELHPEEFSAVAAVLKGDPRARAAALDAAIAIKSLLPPPERRGLVLFDPPFEERNEFEKQAQLLTEAQRRFETGVVILWYPIKSRAPVEAFFAAVARLGFTKRLRAELLVRDEKDTSRLNGCGLLVVNPPYTLEARLGTILPFLAERLGQGPGARFELK